MNHILFAASVGHRMTLGQSIGHALLGAASEHEAELTEWNTVGNIRYNDRGNVDETYTPPTMAGFLEGRTPRPEASKWIKNLIDIARFDPTDYFSADDFSNPTLDIERFNQSLEIDTSDVAPHDKESALKMWRSYVGDAAALADIISDEREYTATCTEITMPRESLSTATFESPEATFTVPYDPGIKLGQTVSITITPQEQN